MQDPNMRSKDVLTTGAVRPWHVLFILVLAYAVGFVAGHKLTLGIDEPVRPYLRIAVITVISAFLYLVFSVVVPELRRALPALFARPIVGIQRGDIGWAIATMLCWGYGFYRVAALLPVLRLWPGAYDDMRLVESVPAFEPRFLLVIGAMVVLAPLGEELMFRGFLMNLWIARKGRWFGVIASSIVFGLFHWEGAVFAGILGIALALIYLKYDSLWPGIALHALYNATTPFWALGGLVSVKPRGDASNPSHWILEIGLAILFFPAAWQFWRRFRPRGA
jgi:hypothetical protein